MAEYTEEQLKALMAKYTEEQLKALTKRWERYKPSLKNFTSFIRTYAAWDTVKGKYKELMKEVGKLAFKHNMLWKMGMVMLATGIKKLQDITDFETYGGAPVFGFEKTVIKCHGRSTEKSINNALVLAAKSVHEDMSGTISRSIANYEHRSGLEEIGREVNY